MAADLDLIEKNGKHLLHLINDVLDLARIEAGRLSLNPEPTSIYNLLEDVMQSNAPLVREKSLDLRLIADPDCDWTAEVDQIRMRQICINLIGNGVKFTENGGIYIELEKLYAVPERGSNLIQVRIRDTGIGIPQDKLEEIFEAFSQVDASTTRKVGGTGLGLPISRRLVEMHGGRLWAESEGIGKGSTFYLDLPVVQQQT
jgi:signal transduction histidine kinase